MMVAWITQLSDPRMSVRGAPRAHITQSVHEQASPQFTWGKSFAGQETVQAFAPQLSMEF